MLKNWEIIMTSHNSRKLPVMTQLSKLTSTLFETFVWIIQQTDRVQFLTVSVTKKPCKAGQELFNIFTEPNLVVLIHERG
jgi:hypothetical protein